MKILIIGPSWVGDMVMSQSLYKTLKKQEPDSTIDVLAPAWCKPILERMPEVNNAIEMPIGHGDFSFKERRKIGQSLKSKQYNQAFILPNSAKSALIPWFANIPKRTGWKGEMRYGLINDLRPNKKVFQYMVERYIALAYKKQKMTNAVSLNTGQSILFPSLSIDKECQRKTMTKLDLNSDKKVIGLCPGAEFGPAKQWPVEYYAKVAEHALNQGKQIWLFGSEKDRETTEAIINFVPKKLQQYIHNLAGQTSLIEAVDLLAACETVVSNDSGLMHVSAAVGCNIVGVYGSTSPEYTPPLTDKLRVIHTDIECRPCFKRECPLSHLNCLKQLEPIKVIEAIHELEAINSQ